MNKGVLLFGLLLSTFGLGQDEVTGNIYYGNQFYEKEDYESALSYFQEAVDFSPLNFKANFNLANTYFRLGNYEKSGDVFTSIADLAPTRFDRSKVYHNLGNTFMMRQNLDEAIAAYKDGLRLNPQDEELRYNLAYAQLLKEEQEKQDQNQDQDNSNNGKNNSNDNNNDTQENSSDGENDPNEENNNNSSQEENNGEENQDNGSNRQPNKISKEQAKRILDAVNKREREVQKLLDQKKKIGTGTSGKKDS